MDIITAEVSTLSTVESLIGEYYSGDGVPIKGKFDKIEDVKNERVRHFRLRIDVVTERQ